MDLETRRKHLEKNSGWRQKPPGGRYSLESRAEGFVFPHKRYSDQAVPLLSDRGPRTLDIHTPSPRQLHCLAAEAHLEVDGRRRIFGLYSDNARLHFRRRAEIILPHLSGAERATVRQGDQTAAADIGRRTPTFMRWSTRANSWVFMESRQ